MHIYTYLHVSKTEVEVGAIWWEGQQETVMGINMNQYEPVLINTSNVSVARYGGVSLGF